ncbi:hypothetical protein DYB30_007881, partial [Aphanomyces astaci]
MANWGVRWNPWDQGYSALEVDQMTFLHKTYCEVYNKDPKDLPHILKMDDAFKVPVYMPVVGDFDEHTFVRKMQDMVGLLKNPAEGIISSICAYQTERHERKSFHVSYLNDPRTLLLEEIKSWALNVLASASCTTEYIVNEVENRMQFIKKIQYGQQKLFTSGSGERSLMATLKDVREILEYRVLPIIETERAHASAKEQLTVLEAKGQDALVHGVQFLFYVFRNSPNAPNDCTIGNLQSQQHAGMRDAMNTKSGQMLQLLLETPGFKELFPTSVYATSQKEKSSHQLLLTNTPDEKKMLAQTAVFCNDQQNAMVPALLGPLTNPAEYLKQSNSGVVALPADTAGPAFDKFCRLHAMLKLMADLIVSCRKARLLAGPGGDLLVYGPGGDAVRRLLQSWQAVQGEVRQLVTEMTTLGVQELDKLKTNQERNWRNCFKEVLSIQGYINNDISACVEPIQQIYRNTDPAKVQRMLKEFREATGQWVEENSSICSQISGTLGLPGPQVARPLGKAADIELIEDDESAVSSALVLSSSDAVAPALLKPSARAKAPENNFIDSIGKSVVSIFGGNNNNVNPTVTSEQHAKADATTSVPVASKATPVPPKDIANDPPLGTLDSLLMVRHVVQAMGSLSWSTRSTVQTCVSFENDREHDAFVILCAVYEAVGVETAPTLWGQVTMYRHELLHALQLHLTFLLHVMQILQHRMVVCSSRPTTAADNIALEEDMVYRKMLSEARQQQQKQADIKGGGPPPANLMADIGYIFG